jgi:hypothetical protein
MASTAGMFRRARAAATLENWSELSVRPVSHALSTTSRSDERCSSIASASAPSR